MNVGNLSYDISIWDNTVSVVGLSNHGYSGDIVISDKIQVGDDYYPVVKISNEAFKGCTGITSVVIPNSILTIGYEAFWGCSNLTSLTIGSGVNRIDYDAFQDCTSLTKVNISDLDAWCKISFVIWNSWSETFRSNPLYYAHHLFLNGNEVKNLIIPNNITSIHAIAFYGCGGLSSVTIGNDVTSIGERAFEKCDGLSQVTIGNKVTSIGGHAFGECSNLTSLTIGNSVISIGWGSFEYCTSLSSVTIPNSVKTIDSHAFSSCNSLVSITMGKGVTSIGYDAFEGCDNLTRVNITDISAWCNIEFQKYEKNDMRSNPLVYAHNIYIDGEEVKDLVIPNGVTSISKFAFYGASGLNSVAFPSSLSQIESSAFYGCSNLNKVIISDIAAWSNINFNDYPLYYGHNLYVDNEEVKDLQIPDGVTSISSYAFYGASGLTSVTIPNSVSTIGGYAFKECTGIKSLTIGGGIQTVEAQAFEECKNLTIVDISDIAKWCKIDFENSQSNPLLYTQHLCINGEEITDLIIPNGVTSISKYAFYGAKYLNSVSIPNSMSNIHSDVFYGCKGLTAVIISDLASWCKIEFDEGSLPSNPLYYAQHIFLSGEEITDLVIPNTITSIGKYSFYGCTGINSVTLHNSVESIGEYAFYKNGLTSIIIGSSVSSIGRYAFSLNRSSSCNCYVTTYIQEPYDINNAFDYIPSTSILYVPEGTVNLYKETNGWRGFNIKEIGGVEPYAVYNDGSLSFYCDNQRISRQGLTYDLNESGKTPGWYEKRSKVTKAIFDASFATARPKTTSSWFSSYSIMEEIQGIKYLNTSNVEEMNSMFSLCKNLKALDVSHFDTKNVKNMSWMFSNCTGVGHFDISNFVTQNVTDMSYMFSNCRSLTSLDFSNFDTSNVTNLTNMFSSCSGLTSLDLSNFDTSNVSHMSGLFHNCTNLMTIYVNEGKWSTENVTWGASMFSNCISVVGGSGTVYDADHIDYDYARIDGGTDAPGYLTEKLENVPIEVSKAKQVAYCSNQNLDFSNMNELKAYVATGYDKTTGTIWLSRVYDVPAHTGFLLIGEADTYEVPVSAKGSTSYYKNMFKGTLDGTTIYTTDGKYTNYYLSSGDEGVGFYKVTKKEGVKLSKNRAYLPIPTVIDAVGEAGSSVAISVGGAEQVPYYSDQSLDFTSMEAQGMKAYTATGYDYATGTIWLSRVKQVPAETGVLIMAPNGDYDVPTVSVASVYENMFKGTLGGTTIFTEEDGFINYYLSNGKDGVGFYKVTKEEGVALGKNRCYLQIPKVRPASSSRGGDASQISADLNSYGIGTSETIGIQLLGSTGGNGDGTTNLRKPVNTIGEPDVYYNLQGQRVDNPVKGLYIKNGKKVIVR